MKPDSLRCPMCGRINWTAAPKLRQVYDWLGYGPASTRQLSDALGWRIQGTSNAIRRLVTLGVVAKVERDARYGDRDSIWQTVKNPLPTGITLDTEQRADGWHYAVTLAGREIGRGGPFDSRGDVRAALAVLALVDDSPLPVRRGGRKA